MSAKILKELDWSETDYIRIPKEWKEKLDTMQSYEAQEEFFFKAIENKKKDIANEIEAMEDNLVEFKAFGLRYKRELEKIYEEQSEILMKLWDDVNLGTKLYEQIKNMSSKVRPLINDVKELEQELSKVKTWNIDKVIQTLNDYKYLDETQKEVLKIMLNK